MQTTASSEAESAEYKFQSPLQLEATRAVPADLCTLRPAL